MAAELREHPRFSTSFSARLTLADGETFDCQVVDYSQSGMNLLWPHQQPDNTEGRHTLTLDLDGQQLNVPAEWVHHDEQHVGLPLPLHDDTLFLRLQEFSQKHRSDNKIDDQSRARYLSEIRSQSSRLSEALPKKWLPEFLEATFDKANKAHNTTEQQQWLKLEKHAKEHAAALLQQFVANLDNQLERWLAGKPEFTPDHEAESGDLRLSLVQQSDFEDWLLAKVTASHLQSRLSHITFELRQLLDALSDAPIEHCFNPIGPTTVTEAFRDALEKLSLDQDARTLAFSIFEQVAGNMLQTAYQQLIKDIDIPLTFRYRKPRKTLTSSDDGHNDSSNGQATDQRGSQTPEQDIHPEASSAWQAPAPLTPGDVAQNFRRHQEEARQAYSNIQNLLRLRYQRLEAEIPENELPQAQPEDIEQIVPSLAQATSVGAGGVREAMEQALAEREVSLPLESRDAIDTLEHVTQHMLGSDQVAGFVKPYIEQLGWPLLQLMLKDASLLFNPDHPGRLILNLLAKLGQLTTSGESQVARKLENLIAPVAENLEGDENSLEELLESLQGLVSSAERKARQNAERVAQAAEGEHCMQEVRIQVEQLIGRDSANRTLPSCVVDWLQNGWQQMLSLLLLREGPDSKRFKGAVKLYRQVLILFSNKNSGRRELLDRFRPMMELARSEMDNLNGNLPEHQRWHDEILQAAEEHLNKGHIREAVDLPAFVAKPAEVIPEGKGMRRAMNLQVGDWLLLTEQDQSVSVVWIAHDASRFACVNHSGMKVIDFTLAELTAAFDEGRVKRLYEQDESAVDRSVDQLVQEIYRDLSEQANVDPLTGLFNRQHFLRLLQERFLTNVRTETPGSLCMIDIDQFKLINKNYGVDGGDTCLQAVASQLTAEDNVITARIGSNEFAVFLNQQDPQQAMATANALKKRIEKTSINSEQGEFRIHLSIGLAAMSAGLEEASELIEQGESACLMAKEKGGSRIEEYQPDDESHQRQDQFMAWGNKLNQALSNNQLQVQCVPVNAIQDRHKGSRQYEVIVSIEDGHGKQIPPMDYLQAAENYNRMYALDRWTIEQLVQWLADNQQTAADISRFMLRLSGHAINDESLLSYIFEQAREKDVPVKKLCFELNETSAIRNLEDAADFMHEMRSLGCKFVLSDFGTGQSSFEYLKVLPVDYVKIDDNFISGLHTSSADYALVKSIQEIAHFMAKKTIAEYSPNNNVWDILRTIGIDFIIGAPAEHVALNQLAQQ